MYYNEHNPPHFHVRYGDHKAEIESELYRYWPVNYRLAPWGWS